MNTASSSEGRLPKCASDYWHRGRLTFEWTDLDGLIARNTPILDQVIFRVDVRRLLASLKPQQQSLAYDLAAGNTTTEVARKHSVTPAAVSQFRKRFKRRWDEFFEE